MSEATRERKLQGWARAVKGLLASDEGEADVVAVSEIVVTAVTTGVLVWHACGTIAWQLRRQLPGRSIGGEGSRCTNQE